MKTSKDIAKFLARIIVIYNSKVMQLGHCDGKIEEIGAELIAKLDIFDEDDVEATAGALTILGAHHSFYLCGIFHGIKEDHLKDNELARRVPFITAVTMYANNLSEQNASFRITNMTSSDKNHIGQEILDNVDGCSQIILSQTIVNYEDIPKEGDSFFLSSAMTELRYNKPDNIVTIPLFEDALSLWDKESSDVDKAHIATILAIAANALPDSSINILNIRKRMELSVSELIQSSLENSELNEKEVYQLSKMKAAIDRLGENNPIFLHPENEAFGIFRELEEKHLAELTQFDLKQIDKVVEQTLTI